MTCKTLKRAAMALVCVVVLSGITAGQAPAAETDRARLAAMIEDAHAVADLVAQQIGVMEDFRRNGHGYMLKDTDGSFYFLPFAEAENLASMLALQVWMGNTDAFRGVGGDLGDLPATIRQAIGSNWGALSTEGELDLEKVNRFVEEFVEASLDLYDETNRASLDRRIDGLQQERDGVLALIEDVELELAALEAGKTEATSASAEETEAVEEDGPIDWDALFAELDIVLPEGVTLVDPTPTRATKCVDPGVNPIFVLTADRSKCTAPWGPYGGKGNFEGTYGEWCAWCPSGMSWRSGSGCCFAD
jgi:hypothetical protein